MGNNALRQWCRERDNALLSLDKEKIIRFCQKNCIPYARDERIFWASVHKAITGINAATDEQKQRSVEWLIENGFIPEWK